MISVLGDVLLPFHSRAEVNLLRSAAYSRYPNRNRIVFFTIIKRESPCRRILNFQDMEKLIRSFNRTVSVVTFEGKSFAEQVGIMRNTHVLITVHGAALTNIVFMPPGGTVIEMIHPDLHAPFYKYMAYFASLNHVEFRSITRTETCAATSWNPNLQKNLVISLKIMKDVLLKVSLSVCCDCVVRSGWRDSRMIDGGVHFHAGRFGLLE